MAVGIVFGSVEITEPFFFRELHHNGHKGRKDKRQDQKPEVSGKEGGADADEHPAGIERVSAPGIDAVGNQAVVLDSVVNLGMEKGVASDEDAQQNDEDAQNQHRSLQCGNKPAIQISLPGENHSDSGQNGNNAHIVRADAEEG